LPRSTASSTSSPPASAFPSGGPWASTKATRTAQAIINLALIAGNIGRPGTGANSITGQCNATSLLGGYDTSNAVHRAHVAATLGLDPALIPDRSGYAYGQILDAIERGEIRGL
jgi:assimilatory nitrate reductase catalytic subunit